MDWTLELVVVPVSDVDRAKAFYLDKAGFELLVDHSPSPEFIALPAQPSSHRSSCQAKSIRLVRLRCGVPAVRR